MTNTLGQDADSDALPDLAQRLEVLFRSIPRSTDDFSLHSSNSVATALRRDGIFVTANHISALRAGRRRNPSARLLAGLAGVFGVPIDYFLDAQAAAELQRSLAALAALRGSGVQQLMLRAHGISRQSLDPVLAILDQIRLIEGLDEVGHDTEGNQT